MTAPILVIDVGTSGVRTVLLGDDGTEIAEHAEEFQPDAPAPGLVEFDPVALIDVARRLVDRAVATTPVSAVGVTNQRATTVVWDRITGAPIGPAIGWQDVRTVGTCLELQAEGIRLAPNATATKAAWLLDTFDGRNRDYCVGTVDSWVIWHLTGEHVTDRSNASATGLVDAGAGSWSPELCARLDIRAESLARIVDSAGRIAPARTIDGSPPVAGVAGDQQASLLGQGCVRPGDAKITFGTGGMLDVCVGDRPPATASSGTFPLVAWHRESVTTYLTEAVMLAAGTSVTWLRDGLGVVDRVEEVDELAASVDDTGGVVFVPAMQGLGTPLWDHGARGALLGLHRGTSRAEICRAVLEGVAARGADLLEAAEADTGYEIPALRVDGGMTASPVFVQALADATQRGVEVSPHREATAVGAGYLAGIGIGVWSSEVDTADAWNPVAVVDPRHPADRDRWLDARARAAGWIPELSGLSF